MWQKQTRCGQLAWEYSTFLPSGGDDDAFVLVHGWADAELIESDLSQWCMKNKMSLESKTEKKEYNGSLFVSLLFLFTDITLWSEVWEQ